MKEPNKRLLWLNTNEYPFKSNYYNFQIGKMHYVDEGTGDPVVMVHGNPAWSFEYRNVIKELSKTHRCIAPDHIGFGLSDKPADWTYLPEHHARNFEIFINSLNLSRITLIVNDWGGPIGLNYALKHPQKIKKLVILNTWLWSVENDPHFKIFSWFMGGFIGKFLTRHFNFFGKSFMKRVVGKKKLSKEIHRHYYMHLETKNDRKGCYTFPKEIIGSSKWLESLWQQKDKINSIPTTFVWGMSDIAFREKELNYWTDNWNNYEVIKLNGIGHVPQEEKPQAVIDAVLS